MMRIPRRGTVNTTVWYCEYHGVVLRVPTRGVFFGTPRRLQWSLTEKFHKAFKHLFWSKDKYQYQYLENKQCEIYCSPFILFPMKLRCGIVNICQ